MKKEEKIQKIRDYSNYVESGALEVANDNNINLDVTNIYKIRSGKLPDSVFVLQDFASKMALQTHYKVNTFKVLFYFIAVSKYENFISVDVKTISEDINISIPSVKRSTKQLAEDNVILKVPHPSDNRRIDYFLNPIAVWRGKSLNRDKFITKAKNNKLQLKLFKEE